MSDVQFTEEQEYSRPPVQVSQPKGLVAWIIGLGLAGNEQDATRMLFRIFFVAVALTGVAIFFLLNSGAEPPPPIQNMPLPGIQR